MAPSQQAFDRGIAGEANGERDGDTAVLSSPPSRDFPQDQFAIIRESVNHKLGSAIHRP